jgi:uncharacterized protein with predicted RNA binding PUA domain
MKKANSAQFDRVEATLRMQFPDINIEEVIGDMGVMLSRKTNRIRSVGDLQSGQILFSLRTSDGRYVPSFEGGLRIIKSGFEKNRIFISKDAVPFVAKGKSAFCKHVLKVDDNIVPGLEVFVMSEDNELIAIGSSFHPGYAMQLLQNGVAAKIKHSRD